MDGQWTANKLVEDKDGKSVDPTVGVVMILSVRITDNVMGRGHVLVDTMIVWVRISGPIQPIRNHTYVPHKDRTKTPTVTNVIERLKSLLHFCQNQTVWCWVET